MSGTEETTTQSMTQADTTASPVETTATIFQDITSGGASTVAQDPTTESTVTTVSDISNTTQKTADQPRIFPDEEVITSTTALPLTTSTESVAEASTTTGVTEATVKSVPTTESKETTTTVVIDTTMEVVTKAGPQLIMDSDEMLTSTLKPELVETTTTGQTTLAPMNVTSVVDLITTTLATVNATQGQDEQTTLKSIPLKTDPEEITELPVKSTTIATGDEMDCSYI